MDKKLVSYAELIIKQGINLENGEALAIGADIEAADLVEEVVRQAYKAGAKKVTIFWSHAEIGKMSYQYQDDETLTDIPDWVVASRDWVVDNKAPLLNILSERPDLLSDVDPQKIKKAAIATSNAMKKLREATGSNKIRWCLAAYPNVEWAEKIFPKLKGEKAVAKLWEYIHKTVRLDTKDPIAAWKTHVEAIAKRSHILTEANLKSLRLKNSLGTDITMDLPQNYEFTGAAEKSHHGRAFTANLPTEEVFASPDYRTTNGKVVASLPLVRRGAIIKDFWMEFKDGRCVDFGAKEGYETLKGIIETDEGSHYLGEVALVGFNSPIQNLKTLFYNTLFDENASCHLAIGRGFSACIKDGTKYTKEELKEMGINDSIEHVDFMIGTSDLSVVGIRYDGTEMEIFKNGDWVF
ncbi:MAG: aminopeptidase [Firmicutes bacterium]|nr:aminopeptidase [Bacillota bacterium]